MVDFWDSFLRMAAALALVLALIAGLVALVRRFAGTRLFAGTRSANDGGGASNNITTSPNLGLRCFTASLALIVQVPLSGDYLSAKRIPCRLEL